MNVLNGKQTVREADRCAGKDSGESECRAVMVRIGVVAPPEREQTSAWSFFARELVEFLLREESK